MNDKNKKISDDKTSPEKDEENISSESNNSGSGYGGNGTNNQSITGIIWAQGNESFYTTQATDHGYRLGIETGFQFLNISDLVVTIKILTYGLRNMVEFLNIYKIYNWITSTYHLNENMSVRLIRHHHNYVQDYGYGLFDLLSYVRR